MLNAQDSQLLSNFLEISNQDIDQLLEEYAKYVKYLKNIFAQDKSLSLKESFVLFALCKVLKVESISELGVRYGISTRFWLETVPGCNVVGYDIKNMFNNRLKPIKSPNFKFVIGDAAKTFSHKHCDLIFYDAHPYKLTYDIAVRSKNSVGIHCFHDVGLECFNPKSRSIVASKRESYSADNGHWERHVMAEVFNPGIAHDNLCIDDEWRSLVIDDKFGVGISVKNSLIKKAKNGQTP